MKTNSSLLIVAAIAGLGALNAHAQNFGINFIGRTTDDVTGTAGVVPIGNYTNVASAAGATTITADDGVSTGTLTISGPGAGNSYLTGAGAGNGGNSSLYDGYYDAGGNGGQGATGVGASEVTFTFTLLPGALYNVYIYDVGDAARPGNVGDGLPDYTVNGTDYFTSTLNGNTPFAGFVQGGTQPGELTTAEFNAGTYPTAGNYIEVAGVSATGGTLTIMANENNETFRSPVDGIELVAVVPEPSPLTFAFFGLVGLAIVTGLRRRLFNVA